MKRLVSRLTWWPTRPRKSTSTPPRGLNPAWAATDAKLRESRAEIARLQQPYGAAALANPDRARPSRRGFKIAHGQLAQTIRAATQRARALEQQRVRIPRRIPVGQRTDGQVIKLATERKHLTNLLKRVAYQAESDLARAGASHYKGFHVIYALDVDRPVGIRPEPRRAMAVE